MDVEQAMDRAIVLASMGAGHVAPNPLVGCVLLHDGEIIGEGYHERFGGAHAEVNAMASVTDIPSDTTLVCTLEPCSHHGKTPPCVDAIIASGIKHVVIGSVDPYHEVQGRGIARLREAGLRVDVGVREAECSWMNRFFLHAVRHKTPYTILKIAQSLDGCVATSSGESQWISGHASREEVHRLRSRVAAICVGSNTVRIDDPQLTARCEGPAQFAPTQPRPVILDTELTVPLQSRVFRHPRHAVVFCARSFTDTSKADELRAMGVEVVGCDRDAEGHLSVEQVKSILYSEYLIDSLLVEAGPALASALVTQNAVDELQVYIAPILLGDGRQAFGHFHVTSLADAARFTMHSVRTFDEDVRMILTKKA